MEANNAYLEGKKLKFGNKMNFYTHEAQQILLDDSLFDLPYFTGCQAMVFAASKQMVIFFHVFSWTFRLGISEKTAFLRFG